MAKKHQHILLFIGFIVVIFFPIFFQLGNQTLREWDEARNAINAYEMLESQNFLIKTYQNKPDLWETKPPLLVWCQTVGFFFLGYNELAVRLPAALSTFSLCLFLYFFFKRYFKNIGIGIIASFILVTSVGYIFYHCTRTGDHDAPLILFEILTICFFYLYFQRFENKYLIYSSIGFTLCILIKSVACFMFFPGVVVYLIFSKKLLQVLKQGKFWLAIFGAFFCVFIFYFLREKAAPGYLAAVWENELFPRYFNTSKVYQYNPKDYGFYFNQIYKEQFKIWYILVIPAFIFTELYGKIDLKRLNRYLFTIAFTFLLILSNATTNSSYVLPIFPLFAIIIAIGIYSAYQFLLAKYKLNKIVQIIMIVSSIIIFLIWPYKVIINDIINVNENNKQVQYGYALKRIEKEQPMLKHFFVFEPLGYNYPLVFYKTILNEKKQFDIQNIELENLKKQPVKMLILDDQIEKLTTNNIPYKIIFKDNNCWLIETF